MTAPWYDNGVNLTDNIEITGHLLDSGLLSRVLDDIREYGGDYTIDRFDVGHDKQDTSTARMTIGAEDEDTLQRLLMRLQTWGANLVDPGEPEITDAELDGVFPDGFYSTTNLSTSVRLVGRWVPVRNPEMDCGLVVEGDTVRTIPMSDVKAGMRIVTSAQGVRVTPPAVVMDGDGTFGFMESDVSSEKPQAVLVRQVADGMREAKAAGLKVLWVGGPAVVHTGAAPAMVSLIENGYVDVLFAGNALATHDIEAALLGTSLGIRLATGVPVATGHNHHLRAINAVRAVGSIAAAVEKGVLTRGVMHACVQHHVDFVLAGSVRDDGPLPDVITDTVRAQDEMRRRIPGVGLAIMVATTLHSVATGNLLPASVRIICVDNNTDTITKLMDRGTRQAFGLVTDCQFFLKELAGRLP